MNKKYILFFLFSLLSITISAQSLAEAKALYEKGEYEEAKPAFKKFVKTQPGNGNYNLWYGVCCLETGDPAEALKHLENASKDVSPAGNSIWPGHTMIYIGSKMPSKLMRPTFPT